MIKNKLAALVVALLGYASYCVDGDGTFFLFTLVMAFILIIANKGCFD